MDQTPVSLLVEVPIFQDKAVVELVHSGKLAPDLQRLIAVVTLYCLLEAFLQPHHLLDAIDFRPIR